MINRHSGEEGGRNVGEKNASRRDYGEGSLYHRESDNRWVGSFYYDGKRKYVYGSVGGKKEEARRKLKEAMLKAEQGTLVGSHKQTLAEFFDYWLETIRHSIEPGTAANYQNHTQRTRSVLGRMQIQKLTRHHIQRFVNSLKDDGLAPSTVHIIFAILDMAMDAAVKWKYLSANPCADVILPKLEPPEQQVLTPEQAQHLLFVVKDQPLEPLIVLALGAGMRKGEICALKWSAIDMEKGLIHVEKKVYPLRQADGHYHLTEGKPKSKASRRIIPLAPFVKEALLRCRKRQIEQRSQSVVWEDHGLVFPGRNGRFFDFSTLRVHFKKLLVEAGLPEVRIHDLRHTCDTLLRMMGIDAVTRQKILGHAKPQITEEIYGHTYDRMKLNAMEKLSHWIFYNNEDDSEAH
jgi:integrase